MSRKNKKNQKPELELSYPYALVTHRYSGGMWISIRDESGVEGDQTIVDTTSEAHYFAAKHGCKVWLDGEKVKAISSVAIAKVQEEETEAGRKAKEEEDARTAKIASMKGRPLTEEEIKELPKLFICGAWARKGQIFTQIIKNGYQVFAESKFDGSVWLVTPYNLSKEDLSFGGGARDPNRVSRLNDDGHF